MPRCCVAFGGNLGPVAETFRAASVALGSGSAALILDRSRLYRTTPIGGSAGSAYLNAVVSLESSLPPEKLLAALQAIEDRFGRKRMTHWGPRTLDLDLVAYGDLVMSSPRLAVPHPHCWYRRFVLDPWNDVAPDFVHPLLGESVAELRGRILERPLPVAIDRDLTDVAELCAAFPDVRLVDPSRGLAAITFTREASHSHRRIDLKSDADRTATAEHVLRAALDEPVPVAGSDWEGSQ